MPYIRSHSNSEIEKIKKREKEKLYKRKKQEKGRHPSIRVRMASPLQAFSVSLLLLIALPHDANAWKRGGRHHAGRATLPKHHRPKFKPGPWKQASATFYEGGSGTFGISIINTPNPSFILL